jgi:hypothetical protein
MVGDQETQSENGKKKLFGIPCGCDNRKQIMGAGEWQMDAMVIAAILLLVAGVLIVKHTTILDQ